MEKAVIIISKSQKGKDIIKLVFENKKEFTISSDGFKANVLSTINNKTVHVERVNGQPVKILYGEEIVFEKNFPGEISAVKKIIGNPDGAVKNKSSLPQHSSHNCSSEAPYNFIPLNEIVVEADTNPAELGFDKYHDNRYSGYIDLTITAKTPIYIRDNDSDGKQSTDFFSPGGKYKIPGSSIRGMIRNLVEIVSFSKLGSSIANNEQSPTQYFYRKFTDASKNLEKQYRDYIVGGDPGTGFYNKISAGYIKKTGIDSYQITPARIINNTQFYRIEQSDIPAALNIQPMSIQYRDRYDENKGYRPYPISPVKVFFQPAPVAVHRHSQRLKYAKVQRILAGAGAKPAGWEEGYLVCTNWMRGGRNKPGKHMHWIIGPKSDTTLSLNAELYKSTKDDYETYSIDKVKDIFKKIDNRNEFPCFYVTENQKVVAFGFTGNFRIPYSKTVDGFLPTSHKTKKIDIAEAIFGNETTFSSRVFFEDAEMTNGTIMAESSPKILASPKATCFQHYLVQDNFTINRNNEGEVNGYKGLKSYNDNTVIRGNKLYWHKNNPKWQETDQSQIRAHGTQYTRIKPVNTGAVFTNGRIRFENLSDVELGSLLFALELPGGCCHKIGMGKPLGLGSIAVVSKLFLSDRKNRYTQLNSEWDAPLFEDGNKVLSIKAQFEKYVMDKLGKTETTLWNVDRLKELKTMLIFNHAHSTDYKGLEDFKGRHILPKPSDVK